MNLDSLDRQRGDRLCRLQDLLAGLAGKPHDDVDADQDRPAGGAMDGVAEGRRVVAPVDRSERPVVDRLEAELQPDMRPLGVGSDQRKRLIGDAVRPRPDGKTDHVLHGERLVVERPELLHRGVGVREGLEIGDEFLRLRRACR